MRDPVLVQIAKSIKYLLTIHFDFLEAKLSLFFKHVGEIFPCELCYNDHLCGGFEKVEKLYNIFV